MSEGIKITWFYWDWLCDDISKHSGYYIWTQSVINVFVKVGNAWFLSITSNLLSFSTRHLIQSYELKINTNHLSMTWIHCQRMSQNSVNVYCGKTPPNVLWKKIATNLLRTNQEALESSLRQLACFPLSPSIIAHLLSGEQGGVTPVGPTWVPAIAWFPCHLVVNQMSAPDLGMSYDSFTLKTS